MAYVTDKICGTEPIDPFLHPLDAILADIAIAVQLPPGLHSKARDRYEAVRTFAEREGSPLRGHILRFYAQGSMAIDATTSTRGPTTSMILISWPRLRLSPMHRRARCSTCCFDRSRAILPAKR
jgi:hypothetical protein